jgi:hypothetical protein
MAGSDELLDQAFAGSIAVIGNPANGTTARKHGNGTWFYTHGFCREVDYDDLYKAAVVIYDPREHK